VSRRQIEPLDPRRHDATRFASGKPELDTWLRRYAGQGERRSTSRTFVLARTDNSVAGYYTLVAGTVDRAAATDDVAAGTSKHSRSPSP
jgi:hypothetical protein